MKRINIWTKAVLATVLALAFVPGVALASTTSMQVAAHAESEVPSENAASIASFDDAGNQLQQIIGAKAVQAQERYGKAFKMLPYDRALIDQIGTQERTGHSICCSSFSCAYADAVMDGTVHSHEYYSCSNCMWTDWGGGNSSFRNVGTDEQLLREAYDQITAGKPTVVHVAASYGEHWIALIGYEQAYDPDHLTLSNFIALDPWDGAQVNAGASFRLYGDGCEHVSDRQKVA